MCLSLLLTINFFGGALAGEAPPSATATKPGDIFVPGPEGAVIFLDGAPTGLVAPYTLTGIAPGEHRVGLRKGCDGVDLLVQVRSNAIERAEGVLVAGTGTLALDVPVPGATVWLDGASLGLAPIARQTVRCGTHRIEVRADGYTSSISDVAIAYGQDATLTATLERSQVGALAVSVTPYSAEVWVDGTQRGVGPLTVSGLPDGQHHVEGRLKGYDVASQPVNVRANETVRVDLVLVKAAPLAVRLGLDRVDWARVGAASGLLLVAGGAAGLASSQFTAADEAYLTYAQLTYADDVESYYRDHVETPTIVAWASVGTASASAGVSALLFATLKPRVAGVPAPVVVPVVTPSTVGVTGTF